MILDNLLTLAEELLVSSEDPSSRSSEIDRIIFDPNDAPPLSYGRARSVLPIECVCGLVEITLTLDRSKLRSDIENMAPIQRQRRSRTRLSRSGGSVARLGGAAGEAAGGALKAVERVAE